MQNVKANIWKLYACTFLTDLLFVAAVIVPFMGSVGLTMQQIMITETFFAASILVFEIPSGYFADIFGRKISMVVGAIAWCVGIIFYSLSNTFEYFLIGAIFWGIGTSFNSGANQALLYETLVKLDREKEYKKVQGNVMFYGRVAATIGSIIGSVLAAVYIRLPVYATLVTIFMCLLVSLTLAETKHKREEHETWRHIFTILKESFVHNPTIRYFIIFAAVTGFFNIEFWLKQRYMEFIGLPIIYFGVVFAVVNIFSGLGAKYAKEIEEKLGVKTSLILIPVVPIITWLVFAYAKTLWVLPLLTFVPAVWGFALLVFQDFVQKLISSDRRATVLSIMSFFRRGIFFVFAPFLGWVTDVYSIQTAFLFSAVIVFVFSVVSLLSLRIVKVI